MNQSAARGVDEIEQALHDQRAGATIAHIGVADLGRLSGEAVMASYEAAAKAVVDAMGTEVKTRVANIEASLRELDADLKLITDAALHIRDKGNLVQAQIDEAAQVSAGVRAGCAEFLKKIGVEPVIAKSPTE